MDRVIVAQKSGDTLNIVSTHPDSKSAYKALRELPEGTGYAVLTFNCADVSVAPPPPRAGNKVKVGAKFGHRPGRKARKEANGDAAQPAA